MFRDEGVKSKFVYVDPAGDNSDDDIGAAGKGFKSKVPFANIMHNAAREKLLNRLAKGGNDDSSKKLCGPLRR